MATRCVALKKRWPHRRCKNTVASGKGRLCGRHPDGGWKGGTRSRQGSRRRRASRSKSVRVAAQFAKRGASGVMRSTRRTLGAWKKSRDARLRKKQENEDRIKAAADFCVIAVNEGLIGASADRISTSVADDVWQLLRVRWRVFRCRWLARLAIDILKLKGAVHAKFGDVATRYLFPLPWRRPEQSFVKQLLTHVPLPGDQELVATANALRVIGVSLCLAQNRDLTECECFRTLALEKGKQQVKAILVSAGERWVRARQVSSDSATDLTGGLAC